MPERNQHSLFSPIHNLISYHNLHGSKDPQAVDVSVVLDQYDCRSQVLDTSILAWSFFGRHRQVICTNTLYHPWLQKIAALHEISHYYLEHPNTLYISTQSRYLYNRFERQADIGASLIAVPLEMTISLLRQHYTLREIADILEVPECIVALRLRLEHVQISAACTDAQRCSRTLCDRWR